jgi:hypothetical protein
MYRPVPQQQQQSVRPALFSQKNRDTLENLLIQDFQSRVGPLNSQQRDRLSKTVDHYVDEVYEQQGEKQLPLLNREIIRATASDFGKYLQRKEVVRSAPETPIKTVMNEQLYQETGRRFELMQAERQETKALPPSVPDFRISLDEEGPSSAELYERAKRARESEALRIMNTQNDAMQRLDAGLQLRNQSDTMFHAAQQQQNKATDIMLSERRNQPKPLETPLIVPPDRRDLMLPANVTIQPDQSLMPYRSPLTIEAAPTLRDLGQANSNPTITEPQLTSPQKVNLQQDVLIRQDNIVSYREIENNLFIYSADRDWLKNTRENRYSFTVAFDPANNGQTYGPSPAAQQRFKNITRIELVKAIMPAEAIDVLITQDLSGVSGSKPNTLYQYNILSFPFVTVAVQELDGNNYGTDNFLDRSFGVLQYDANWYSDPASLTDAQDSRGYLAMIPKFMKCQRVYHPTPLSTLQKMTISLLRPDGSLISSVPDTLDIAGILASNNAAGATFASSLYDVTGAPGTTPAYYFINTSTYFSRFQIAIGDRIQIAGFTYNDATLAANPGLADFANWLNRSEGHIVAAIGYSSSGTYMGDTANSAGYANYIIIQARYANPTSGSTDLLPFTGFASVGSITAALADATLNAALLQPRRLINLNRQIQLVFRIITREMDSVGQLRPDNM